jgi:thiamine biosynthesis lipoprotein
LHSPRTAQTFSTVSMDTGVNIQLVTDDPRKRAEAAVQRALAWFDTVERICSRFDRGSEVMQLLDRIGTPTPVSTLLFECIAFAMDLAEQTDGAFDPTIGAHMEQLGFNTNYKTLETVQSHVSTESVSFRHVKLDRRARTVLLRRPLVLDLNAVAKGLAIDLASRELQQYRDVSIEAGGDVLVRGHNATGEPWHIGVQHPRAPGLLAYTLRLTDTAVCTSGDYERRTADGTGEGHILDGRTHRPVSDIASVTVVARTAMAADGLSTAAMVLGTERGLRFLEDQGVGGLMIAPDGTTRKVNLP